MTLSKGLGASQVVQWVKNPLAKQERQVRSLGWEHTPEEGMATHSSILAWRIAWTGDPVQFMKLEKTKQQHQQSKDFRYKIPIL